MLVREVTYNEGGFTRLTFEDGGFHLVDSDGQETCFLIDWHFVNRSDAERMFAATLVDLEKAGVYAATDTGYLT